MINTAKYIRKPLYVDGVRLTTQNFDEVAAWCQGEVLTEKVPGQDAMKPFVKVRVHNPKNPRQTKAFIGDWLLYTERGYKVYTNKAFHASFDLVIPEEAPLSDPRLTGDPIVDMNREELDLVRPQSFPTQPVVEEVESTKGVAYEEVPTRPITEVVREQREQPSEQEPLGGEFVERVKEPGLQRAALAAGYPIDPDEASVEERIVAPGQVTSPDVGVSSSPSAPPKDMGLESRRLPVFPAGQSKSIADQAPEDAAAGKRVLSLDEQQKLLPEEVRDLLETGEVVLAQDLAH